MIIRSINKFFCFEPNSYKKRANERQPYLQKVQTDNLSKTGGFTLIEVLVVISIIALLVSVLIPTLAIARKNAKDVACKGRLRQWAIAFELYYRQNNGKPYSGSHYTDCEELMQLIGDKRMCFCPSASRKENFGPGETYAVTIECDSSYGLNLWHGCDGGDRAAFPEYLWLTNRVKNPHTIPLFMDCFYDIGDECDPTVFHTDNPPQYEGQPAWGGLNEMVRVCINRHNYGINCLFLDYSVRRVGLKELWELKWHRKWFHNKSGQYDPYPPVWPNWMKNFRAYSPFEIRSN